MFNESFTINCLIIITIFIIGIFIGSISKTTEKIDNFILDGKIIETIKNRNELPYGYTMETNGKEFAYIDDRGNKILFPKDSLEEAIKSAWIYYDYTNNKSKEIWKPFEINKDKN